MERPNCWEFTQCGRAPGGAKVGELGICPATTCAAADGLNGGRNAGRICWSVAGTFCGGEVQGIAARKQLSCTFCEFYRKVEQEEGPDFFSRVPGRAGWSCARQR